MAPTLRPGKSRWRGLGQLTPWLLLVAGLLIVRLSKGAGFSDAYALLSRPFWPGPAQREWVTAAVDLEERSRLQLLEDDNRRLRGLLELQQTAQAPVVVLQQLQARALLQIRRSRHPFPLGRPRPERTAEQGVSIAETSSLA